ncbi:MAG: cardiolipin synthase [Verrucomicrobiales bacterium]|nr:cardiolipin synthase [Verrucomicrobiales bacterium]
MKNAVTGFLGSIRLKIGNFVSGFSRKFPRTASFLGVLRRRRRPIRALLHVVFHAVGLVCSVFAVMQSRTEQGAVAWAISLNTVPIVAVPAWFVFGDSKLDSYTASRTAGLEKLRPYAESLVENLEGFESKGTDGSRICRTLEKLASMPMTRGNHVDLLVDGKNTFDSIFDAIEKAEEYILVQFYIVRDDELGGKLKDKLIEKAKEGVRVRLLVDNYGALGLPDRYFGELREAGVDANYFMELSGEANRFQLNFRNHRKLVVVDGKVGFVGGHNVGDEYLGYHPTLTPWRDSHIRMEGPVVKTLQIPFVEDWHWATGEVLEDLEWEITEDDLAGEMDALCLATGPADPMETCAMFFLTAINEAEDRVWIATPYFVPDDKIVTALQLAAVRGVDVRVLMPDLSDSRLVYLSSFSYLKELEQAGVKLYRYEKGFLHQKAVLIDDRISSIGSANFDNRSFRLNFEITGIVDDPAFNQDVAEMFETDFSNSRRAKSEDYTEEGFFFRLQVRLARLLAPIQ